MSAAMPVAMEKDFEFEFSSVINLMSGQPDASFLPTEIIAEATLAALTAPSPASDPLNYGDNQTIFAQKVSDFLMKHDNRTIVNPGW
jgi:hypothetical protein